MNTPTPTTLNTAAPEAKSFHGSSLELRNLTMAYGDIEVLRNVSLTVAPGTTTCIIGPSGSGKSTLLRGVNRLHEPKSGNVLLAGESTLADQQDGEDGGQAAEQVGVDPGRDPQPLGW